MRHISIWFLGCFFLSLLCPSGCSLHREQLLMVWERRLERIHNVASRRCSVLSSTAASSSSQLFHPTQECSFRMEKQRINKSFITPVYTSWFWQFNSEPHPKSTGEEHARFSWIVLAEVRNTQQIKAALRILSMENTCLSHLQSVPGLGFGHTQSISL